MRHRCWIPLLLASLCALAGGCRPAADAPAPVDTSPGADKPAQAVRLLTRHLHDNALDAYARDAVPADVHAQLEAAWREGRTRWPLDELPLGERLPQMLAALEKPGSEAGLRRTFDRQFANADREIDSTASTLGLFGVAYIRNEGDFSDSEREHYTQIVTAMSRWAQSAPLADPARGHAAIAKLAVAARRTGLASEADFARFGLQDSLRRLGPFAAVGKQALATYGLDLDASLAGLDASLQSQTGDTAKVRMRYTLGGEPIDAVVEVERHDGRWYLSDILRHARAAVERPPGEPAPPAPGAPGAATSPATATEPAAGARAPASA
jgi:hypothetical protein